MNEIFNRKLLQQNRLRTAKAYSNHSFLYHEIANRIVEDLEFFADKFENVLEIGARDGYLSGLLADKKIAQNLVLTDLIDNFSDKNSKKEFSQDTSENFNKNLFAQKITHITDDENLPFEEQSFNLIISNLNLHHINNIPQFLVQVKNLLKPGGIFIASFFGQENLKELHETIFKTEQEIYGGVSPRMIPTIDVKTAAMLLQKAGFANPVSNLETIEVSYDDAKKLLQDLKNMGQGNIMHKRSRRFFTRAFLEKLMYNYPKEQAKDKTSHIKATFEIITIVGLKK